VPLKMYAAKAIDVEGMKVVAGEWSEKEIEERGLDIIGDIVAEWDEKTKLHFGGPVKTVVFSATVDHGAELCKQFQGAGFNFQQISYKDGGDQHRRDLIAEFRKA
jgi:DNA repair protein RadD